MHTIKRATVNLPELYPAQLEVYNELTHPSGAKFITVNGSRQVGKSFLLVVAALVWALEAPKQLVMIVSPTDQQVGGLYKRTLETLAECMGLLKAQRSSGGQAELTLINGSRILYRSAKSADGLRGHALDALLCDEFAFFPEEVYTRILAPSLTVRGRHALFVSTPKGSNFFKRMYERGVNGEKGYKSFKITYEDNPYANLEFINEQKATLPTAIFSQEYEGLFVDSANVFPHTRELATLQRSQPIGQECVAGIDVAMVRDFTVCVILDFNGNMLDYIRFNKLEMSEAIDTLYNFLAKWNPVKTIIESNNQGVTFISSLRERGVYGIESFNTTASSKPLLINQLIAALNKKEVRLLNDEILINEFLDFTYTVSQSGQLRFAASQAHDDIVMAFSFAHRAKNTAAGGSFFIH